MKFQNDEGLVVGSNEKGEIWMNKICMKVDEMESENII
jgi:hypothetical protein